MPSNHEKYQSHGQKSMLERTFLGVKKRVSVSENIEFSGTVVSFDGQVIESSHFPASIGSECIIESKLGASSKGAIVGFRDNKNIIFQYEKSSKILSGDKVTASFGLKEIEVGPNLLGRVIDGLGHPLDGQGSIDAEERYPVEGKTVNPFDRGEITEIFDVGIKSINAVTSIGRGPMSSKYGKGYKVRNGECHGDIIVRCFRYTNLS